MNSGSNNLLKFLMLVGDLKHIPRTGWVRKNVQNPERIAGHMYRMGVMSMLFNDGDGVDRNKCMRLALVHDVAEAIVGEGPSGSFRVHFGPGCKLDLKS